MRLIKQVEHSFVQQIVKKTREIVANGKPLSVRVSTLQAMALRQSTRLAVLERRMADTLTSQARQIRLSKLAALRRKAFSYFVSTAKFLVHREIYHMSMSTQPRAYALPEWASRREQRRDLHEIPFMEFSS